MKNMSRLLAAWTIIGTAAAACGQAAAPGMLQPTILYGAAYYNEYMPAELQPGRLEKDVAMMHAAGITVVRMGESTWSLWEPSDGTFDYAWMDRVVAAMQGAGIKVIMGTPTYSIPAWMAKAHPEVLARPLGGAFVGYGMRQNMDYDNPVFRRYAERLIANLVSHYKDNPAVIGWQIDNETGAYGASNEDVFQGFVEHLKQKFGTTDALNKAWFLNYWGQDVNDWADMPTRDNATSTSYKLEWSRWQQMRVAAYLAWQAELVRKNRRPDQFVTQDFGSMMKQDVNEPEVAKSLDVVANNPYHGTQKHMDGWWQAIQGDYSRSLKQGNFLVTETNAQTLGWDSTSQYPPYDGQLRLDVYTDVSSGANMVEYWHWHSIHAGQETYWKGVLSHDLEPNRAYAEVTRVAHELHRIGPQLANMKIENKVAILYSVDSSNAISFMPYDRTPAGWVPGKAEGGYNAVLSQIHRALYLDNVGVDFVWPNASSAELAQYKLLIVPVLYSADDALLKRISDYVHGGGHVLMTFKSGFTSENSAVRWQRAPGPLAQAAGFTYQEFSNLEEPLSLKGDPLHVGADENKVHTWAEFLQLTTAKPVAYYDDAFLGQWPAITTNQYGSGSLTYEGTLLSDELQAALVLKELKGARLTNTDQALPPTVRVKHGLSNDGHRLHYYLNYSSNPAEFAYSYSSGNDLLTEKPVTPGTRATIPPWGVMVVKENTSASR